MVHPKGCTFSCKCFIKKKELELRGMKNRISMNEFNKKIEILKDAKLRARRAFMNGIA